MAQSDISLKFLFSDPEKTGSGEKYRRKSKSIRFSLNLKLTLFPGGYIPCDDDSKPSSRKRPRITTAEDPKLWKFSQTLELRVSELETHCPERSMPQFLDAMESRLSKLETRQSLTSQHHSAEADTGSTHEGYESSERLAALAVRISKLERDERITYNFGPTIDSPKFSCPDPDCKRTYKEVSDLNKHLRDIHGLVGFIVFGRACHSCGRFFSKTRDLIFHEKSDHGEDYASRMESYLPFFKQSQGKPGRSCLLSDLTRVAF